MDNLKLSDSRSQEIAQQLKEMQILQNSVKEEAMVNAHEAISQLQPQQLALFLEKQFQSPDGKRKSYGAMVSDPLYTFAVQSALSSLGYLDHVDEYYGKKTTQSVEDFQEAQSLKKDGLVGGGTFVAMVNALNAVDTQEPFAVAKQKDTHSSNHIVDNAINATPVDKNTTQALSNTKDLSVGTGPVYSNLEQIINDPLNPRASLNKNVDQNTAQALINTKDPFFGAGPVYSNLEQIINDPLNPRASLNKNVDKKTPVPSSPERSPEQNHSILQAMITKPLTILPLYRNDVKVSYDSNGKDIGVGKLVLNLTNRPLFDEDAFVQSYNQYKDYLVGDPVINGYLLHFAMKYPGTYEKIVSTILDANKGKLDAIVTAFGKVDGKSLVDWLVDDYGGVFSLPQSRDQLQAHLTQLGQESLLARTQILLHPEFKNNARIYESGFVTQLQNRQPKGQNKNITQK